MLNYDIVVCGKSPNLRKELNNYVWNDKKAGVPIDAFNHLIDGARYGVSRLLRGFFVG
jgi:phage terminase large subunit